MGKIIAFILRRPLPILLVLGFLLIVGAMRSCWSPMDIGKSRDTIRAERDAALADKIVTEHERDVANRATELAEETHQDRERVREVVRQADEEIDDAVSQADFDRLYAAYARGYCGVFDDPGCAGVSDPAPAGADPLRRADPDRA